MTITPQAAGRPALIGLLGGIVELTTVSQISVFGVPADLSPLLVALGRLPHAARSRRAVFGFCLGLFVDTALLQTLGVNSLVLHRGRLRRAAACASCATRRTRSRRVRDRRRRHRGRHDRLLAAAVPARRRGAGVAAAPARRSC